MRITNKIIQRNNLSNINTNKIYQDKLSTQMSTQKKINRPSDDPVVAIRALRLRSNVNEITQYYGKNIPDAESWLNVTEAGLKNLSQIMTNMITRCTTGSNGSLNTSNRKIILEELRGLGEEVYSTGDADYAGRYVFTGYRTDTPLSFMKDQELKYSITEQLDSSAIDSVMKVYTDKLLEINSSNYADVNVNEQGIYPVECYRIRLAYNNCSYDGQYDDLQAAQKALLEDAIKNHAAAINGDAAHQAATNGDLNGSQIGNVNLMELDLASADAATIDAAVQAVVAGLPQNTDEEKAIAEKLKNWKEAPEERLKDYYADINTQLRSAPLNSSLQLGRGLTYEEINADPTIGAAIDANNGTNTWTSDWQANMDAFSGLGSPVVEFTTPDGVKHVWKGLAEGGSSTTSVTDPATNVKTETEEGVITLRHSYEDPHSYAASNPDAIVYVPETGELLLGSNRYETLMKTKDLDATQQNEAEIRVSYEKSNWQKGDLRPEHYFYCKSGEGDKTISYNENYLDPNPERQNIEYDVGFNQTIRVNSTADECFQHNIGREVDDIVNAMQEVVDLEGIKANIEEIMKSLSTGKEDADKDTVDSPNKEAIATLKKQLDAVDKALTYAKDKEQKLFEKGISTFQKHLDDASLCITDCGTRSSKLALIKNRMENQKTTFDTLKSENEDVDITEVAIHLDSAELTYNAALMATGKVTQSTLLNYI